MDRRVRLHPVMDLTGLLHQDMLLDVLGRLQPRSLAASRCVNKAWRAAVDDHNLLRTDLLPLSLDGVLLQLRNHDQPFQQMEHRMPVLFSRRSTLRKIPAMAGHPKPPSMYECNMWGSCNGLILLGDKVLNRATLEWAELPPEPDLCVPTCNDCRRRRYLVFDPAVSPHYEVVLVPDIPFHLPAGHISKHVCKDKPVWAMEWPPTLCIMLVFSSKTGDWKERPFVREGEAAGTVAGCRSKHDYPRKYAAYWHRALYVLCEDDFILRINMSDDKYQVVNLPERKRLQSHAPRLGKSEKGVYCGIRYARDAFQVWFLDESCGRLEWVFKNDINFGHVPKCHCNVVGGSWILQGNDNSEEVVKDNSEWDPSNENVVSVEDFSVMCGPIATIDFLGFHPYKEIAMFASNGRVIAYYMSTSKVRGLGYFPMGSNQIEVSFPYMPCWIGPLPGSTSRAWSNTKPQPVSKVGLLEQT